MDELKSHINKLREDFSKGALTEKDVQQDPSLQFQFWLQQAVEARITEVQAMTLSTVSIDNKPSSRIVYLREFENSKFWFYTNYNSRKGQELSQNPHASLTFFWKELERQIRIEGTVTKASKEHSDAYFNARPYDSKIGAWASDQSEIILSRTQLEEKVAGLKKIYSPENIIRPDFWGGYVLTANHYEFWQGRNSRLHDRIAYSLQNNNIWTTSRLSP